MRNKTLLKAFASLISLLIIIVSAILPYSPQKASGWQTGWHYRQKIEIQGSGSIAGNVTVTNGLPTVLLSSGALFTDWLPGDQFKSTDGVWYTIGSISKNETIQTVISGTGNWTVPNITSVQVLVVGGGGAGGYAYGGGGGAGGVLYDAAYAVTPGAVMGITVGAGGTTTGYQGESNGGNSVFGTLTAIGGGYGSTNRIGANGGSGGGGSGNSVNTVGTGTAGPPRQGYDGGVGIAGAHGGGGGGGAGAVGVAASGDNSGAGGVGVDYSATFGTSVGVSGWFAGGGAGGGNIDATQGAAGGTGGGGACNYRAAGTAGTANTGGGGGGGFQYPAATYFVGEAGGSGVVIVKYVTTINTLTLTTNYAGSTLSGQTYDMRHVDYPIRFDLMSNKSVLGINHNMKTKGATEALSVSLDVGAATTLSQTTTNSYIGIGAVMNTRVGERFTNFPQTTILRISFKLYRVLSPTGTLYVRVRDVATDSILGTLGTIDVSTLTTLAGIKYYSFANFTSVYNPSAQDIRIMVEYSGGDVNNYVGMAINTSSAYEYGVETTYYSGSYTDTAGEEATWENLVYGAWDYYGTGAAQVFSKGDGTYFMLYGGWSHVEVGEDMRLGLATSPNLTNGGTWTKSTAGVNGTSQLMTSDYFTFLEDLYIIGSTYYAIIYAWDYNADAGVWPGQAGTGTAHHLICTSTDATNWTQYSWLTDLTEGNYVGDSISNATILKDNNRTPLCVDGYYYMAASNQYTDVVQEHSIALWKSTQIEATSESYTTGDDAYFSVYGNNRLAQTFTTTVAEDISEIALKLSIVGTPTGNARIAIYDVDGNSKPTGAALIYGDFPLIFAPYQGTWATSQWAFVRLKTPVTYSLLAATKYAIVVYLTTANDSSNYLRVAYDSSSASYAGGGKETSTDAGSTWSSESSTEDVLFKIEKQHWTLLGRALDPANYPVANSYANEFIFDPNLLKWGNQYVLLTGGGNQADITAHPECVGGLTQRRGYFSYTDDISDINSWVMCKEPWNTSDYKFEGRSSFYDDGTILHIWEDHRTGDSQSTVRVLYYYNNINSIISLGGHALATFADVRWRDDDDSAALKHFMEESVQDSVNGWASQWVKVPLIPSSGTSTYVYLYYGNATATTTEDPANVFTFFDHFTSLDAGVWDTTGTVTQSGSLVTVAFNAAYSTLQNKTAYATGNALLSRVTRVDSSTVIAPSQMLVDASNARTLMQRTATDTYNIVRQEYLAGVDTYATTTMHWRNDNVYHVLDTTRTVEGYSRIVVDQFLQETINVPMTGTFKPSAYNGNTTAGSFKIDWIAVRKLCTTEPVVWSSSAVSAFKISNHLFWGVNF